MIFEDPSSKRWRRAMIVFALLALASLAALGITLTRSFIPPPVPNPLKSEVRATLVKTSLEHDPRPVYTPAQKKRQQAIRAQERRRRSKIVADPKASPLPLPAGAVVGFLSQDDPNSVAVLERRVANIDVVVPDWFELPGATCELVERIDDKTKRVLGRSDALVLPRLANLYKDQWRGEETSKFLATDDARQCMVKKLVERLVSLEADGLNLDLETLKPGDTEPLLEFVVELRAALHAHSMRLTVDVPFYPNPAFDIEYIGNVADAVMFMAYDQHYPTSGPGPVASRTWFAEGLADVLPRLPSDRVVIVLGAYGYDWPLDEPGKEAEALGFKSIMDLARVAGANPVFEQGIENGHFGYRDVSGKNHEVWFQDALSTYNQVAELAAKDIKRYGIWRLGTEDETTWAFLGAETMPPASVLSDLPPVRSVDIVGEGEVFSLRGEQQPGARTLQTDREGRITAAAYSRIPGGLLVEKRGARPKMIALTFDDGPDEGSTAKVLDVLKSLKVPGTFFVVGQQALTSPELVERMAEEGHLVGNHTFSHPRIDTLTPREASAELATTQRLIEGLTGKRTPLFRAPYTVTVEPENPSEMSVLRTALQNGYLFVGANVDSEDWRLKTGSEIANKVVTSVTRGDGNIVLLHDGGGPRSPTVDALKRLVPDLRSRGYEFVSLDKLLGISSTELVAELPPGERFLSKSDRAVAYVRGWGWTGLALLFFVCTVLSILRILFLGGLALRDLRVRQLSGPKPPFEPLVTVILPAFNEGKVIAQTIRSLFATTYKNIEIVCVDDGSTDDTAAVVEAMAANDERIRLIRQPNGGKASAANRALQHARGEIVVAVDADTVVAPEAIPRMIAHFSDPAVTAVCGNVEVGNVNSFITTFQAIEYVTSQNFDRRAFSLLNCISVVPGALGAWRRDAVLAAGGYSHETLTEDADLTLTILRRGGRVVYEPEAVGKTEAPENLGALLKQRFRWTYGTYQCLWKHRSAFFKGTLGWAGLPNMVIFQVVFPLLSPIGDIIMVVSIFRGDWQAFLAGYVAFLLMDMCGSILAFTLDKKPLRYLPLLFVQRFTYRQIMYYVCFKAMLAAVRGARHGWKKLDRTGSVTDNKLAPT